MKVKKSILAVCLMLLMGFLPYLLPVTHLGMITEIAFFSLFAVSYNILFGYGGLLSFGHGAYFGIGAYTVAILLNHDAGLPLLVVLLFGGLAAGLGGLLTGVFCVRLKGAYFALLTMAFNQFFFAIALKWRTFTGGDDGLNLKRTDLYLPGLGTVSMNNAVNVYYLVIVVVILCLFVQWYFSRTPFGNSVRALKENDQRAGFIGYNVYLSNVTLYATCSFFAGIAGSLFAFFQQFVSTSCIDVAMSMQAVFMTFIGGIGSFSGPVLGAGLYLYFTDWVSRITDRWEFVLGVFFVLLVMYGRTGLVGFLDLERIKGALRLGKERIR